MPATVGEIVKRSGAVPPDAVNAVDVSARPKVVVTFDPPAIATGILTRIVIAFWPIAPTISMEVTVS